MTREGIKDIINNSYKYSSEGFLIDVDLASEKIVKYFDQETQRLKSELDEFKEKNYVCSKMLTNANMQLDQLQSELKEKHNDAIRNLYGMD